jgi:HlyD family secretion protein
VTIPVLAAALALRATVFAPERIAVRTLAVSAGRVEETVTNSRAGTVKARRRARLSPEIAGTVVALPHRAGDRVRSGEVLLRLDDALLRARRDVASREAATAGARRQQACLAAERARREAERAQRLAAEAVLSADLLDQAQSTASTAEAACAAAEAAERGTAAAVRLAEVELAKAVLRAPFPGVLGEVTVEVGEWTTPSPPVLPVPGVLDLIDTSSLYVSAPMDEVDAGRIRVGQPARVTVDSFPGRSFPGHVARLAAYVTDRLEQNRTLDVEVEVDDPVVTRQLLPGTSADAEVILDVRDDVLRLPTSVLVEGSRVLVVEKGHIAERAVTLGMKNWEFAEVLGGVMPGERVVATLDRAEVKPGARVRPAEPGGLP